MFLNRMSDRIVKVQTKLITPSAIYATHTATCPTNKPVCPTSSGGSSSSGKGDLVRAERSGKVRLGFIPEEWFLFFHGKTGVSGPYVFGISLCNYLVSKEIFVMEHEYYLGLSILIVIIVVVQKFGAGIGASLDKEVDDTIADWEKGRKQETEFYQSSIKEAKDAQWRAEGQKLLIDAKKENIAMQLEAAYRERCMLVYRMVKGRMDYHLKRYKSEARIHQKWMIGWILENVRKSITPDFEQQALQSAIQELSAAASRAK